MNSEYILLAFGLTLFAGLCTGIGSLVAIYSKHFSHRFLSLSLGFSAGVMIYVSFVEIFQKALVSLQATHSDKVAYIYTTLAFFGGMAIAGIIDRLVPSHDNPHELNSIDEVNSHSVDAHKHRGLYRMGMFSAIAIAIHNFPEGLATFMATIADPFLGVSIAVAIAIHNIPEGIAVAVPIYYATKSRWQAFKWSFLSGLAEPIGALLGFFLLRNIFSDSLFGIIFAGVAGIMIYISLDELLPAAEKFGEHHLVLYGLISGMALMATSLVLFV
jgi:ZIP family zinc transporter